MPKSLKLALACLLLAGLVGFGATQAGGASSTGPDPEPSQANAPDPFASYTRPAGPELSDSAVDTIAQEQARIAGDPNPTSITATSSTYGAATAALDPEGTSPASASAGEESYRRSAVRVLVMDGDFRLDNSRVPRGYAEPSGPVLFLVIDAHTGKIDMRGIEESNPTAVAQLGNTRTIR
jgi:hypothetical protein